MADTATAGEARPPQRRGLKDIFTDYVEQKIEFLLFLFRTATVVCTLAFLLATFGILGDYASYYEKALLLNAITSALRLHQRMPQTRLDLRTLGNKIVEEDSGHYLIYSLLFLLGPPLSMALLPPTLFALVNTVTFWQWIFVRYGRQESLLATKIREFYVNQRVNIFQLIAVTEILLAPTILVGLISGRSAFFMPFAYYFFLIFRYSSLRNPYNKHVFHEMRLMAEQFSRNPSCPSFLNGLIHKAIAFISDRAPQVNG